MEEQASHNKKSSPWLIGCLVGCGAVVLIVGALIGAGAFYVRRITSSFGESVDLAAEVDRRFGEASRFVPWAEEAIPAARIEAFLRARAAMAPQRARLEETFGKLPVSAAVRNDLQQKKGIERVMAALSIGRDAMDLAPAIGEFMKSRSHALLDSGMGMGEYEYLYVLCYDSWLKQEAGDGFGKSGDVAMRRVRAHLLQIMRNQLAAIPADAGGPFRDTLTREIESMDEDPGRLPWQEGLPPGMLASLEPLRARIVAAWSPATSHFELAVSKRRGKFSVEVD